jgi:phage gp36-like protein
MYATVLDVERRLDPVHLIELADDDRDGMADAEVVEAAIADADGLIDAYLQDRYPIPLDPVPALVRKLSIDLAVANLFARRRESVSPAHEARARLATEILIGLNRGEIILGGLSASRKGSPESTTRDVEKTFGRDALETF